MRKVLYINGNPQKEAHSFSRRTGTYYLDQLRKSDNQVQIDSIHVYEDEVPMIDESILSAWGALGSGLSFDTLSAEQQVKVGQMNKILTQFKDADEVIFATPLWNFGVTPMMKAYIDNILIAGETFKYSETGPVGLLENKKATIIQASGGFYTEGPGVSMEHGTNYLKTVLNFVGITDIKTLYVQGIAMPDLSHEAKLEEAYKQVDALFDVA